MFAVIQTALLTNFGPDKFIAYGLACALFCCSHQLVLPYVTAAQNALETASLLFLTLQCMFFIGYPNANLYGPSEQADLILLTQVPAVLLAAALIAIQLRRALLSRRLNTQSTEVAAAEMQTV